MFSSEADRFKSKIFALFTIFALLLFFTALLNYLLQKTNSDLKYLRDISSEEYVHWQKISEKYRFLLDKSSPAIASHTASRIRSDLVSSAIEIIGIQKQYKEIFYSGVKNQLFWPKEATLDLVSLGSRELDVLYWLYDYFGSAESVVNVESIVITRPLESAVLLRSSWRGRVIHINDTLEYQIEHISHFIKYVVASSYVCLIAILAFINVFCVRPALHRLKQFSLKSQRKLDAHLALASYLEDVSKDSKLLDNPLENAQWVLSSNAIKYPVLEKFKFTLCKEISMDSTGDERVIHMPIRCGLVENIALQVFIPDEYQECREDILPFVAALSSHVGLVSEIHARKTAEQQRDIYYSFADTAVNGLPSPIVVFDENGAPIIVNPAFRELFGFDEKNGKYDFNLSDVKNRHEALVAGHSIENSACLFSDCSAIDTTLYYKGGRSLSWSRLPIGDLGLAFVAHDITAVKDRLELQEHHKRLEYLGRMSGSAAHDINNMLAIIMNTLELVAGNSQTDYSNSLLIESAVNTCQKAADINRQLVSFARRQNLAPVAVTPETLVAQIELFLENESYRRIKFVHKIDSEAIIYADPSYLASSIINIVKNSIEAMRGVGTIALSVSVLSANQIMILVSDNGPGFTEEEIDQVLQPFYTSKPAGAGLGLAAVYGFVRQSNGQLALANKSGASITITLPRHLLSVGIEERALEVMPLASSGRDLNKSKILLVEDNEPLRQVITTHLSMLQYSVTSIATLEGGADIISQENTIDLLVTDIMLADGLGFDLAKLAREFFPNIEIIYITGYGTENFTNELEGSHGKVLEKPFSLKKLSETISSSMGERRRRGSVNRHRVEVLE